MSTINFSVNSPWCHYEDILIKEILQTHAPDGRDIDSRPLLGLVEEIMYSITTAKAIKLAVLEKLVWADRQKELGHIIHHISREIVRVNSRDRSLHASTMSVLELVGNHPWGMKVSIVLAALAKTYGELWLIFQKSATSPIALSVARLKRFQNILMESVGYQSKALSYLFENMVNVAKCISEFEMLPAQYTNLDIEEMASMKAHIHLASYWLIRSSVACALSSKQMYMNSVGAKWELWSSSLKINYIQTCLRKQLDHFYSTAEKCISSLFEGDHDGNQKVLCSLFSLNDEFPFRAGLSLRKVGVEEFINKEVLLFISNPVIQLEKFLLIVEQLQSHSNNEPKNLYEIVWIPIASSISLSPFEERCLNHIIETWPWYSLFKPSLLSLPVLKYIREEWHFHADPLLVVLDSKGKVLSLNSFDMVAIWGELAYPFSIERERELWEGRSLTFEILLDGLDPLISYWMDDRRIICLYGSGDIQWVREVTNKMKDITEAGISLELIYVGSTNTMQAKDILETVIKERLSRYLSLTKISMFWLRLESIRNSKSHIGYTTEFDVVMREVDSLFNLGLENKGWLLVSEGLGNEILRLSGSDVSDCLSLFHAWGGMVNTLGFIGSIRKSLQPPLVKDHCGYFSIIPYTEGMDEKNIVCEKCNGPMEKNYMYQCSKSKD